MNSLLERKGRVFSDRYHDRLLNTPAEVRNALAYVLNNARRHAASSGHSRPPGWVDPCSSGSDFDGWASALRAWTRYDRGLALPRAQSWLLKEGWRRIGLIRIDEVPGGRGRHASRPGTGVSP